MGLRHLPSFPLGIPEQEKEDRKIEDRNMGKMVDDGGVVLSRAVEPKYGVVN